MAGAIERELSRRGFLVGAGAGAFALSGLVRTLEAASAAAAALAPDPAGLAPDDPDVRATIAAYIDTIVPGPAGGADADPGALEAGALDEVYDPFYGAVDSFPYLHRDLQLTTARVLGRPARFDLALPYADRERVVLDRLTANGDAGPSGDPMVLVYAGPAVVAYFAFYGTARSDVGPRYIGFPPASNGYWPHHSYRLRFRGMTRDGNPR